MTYTLQAIVGDREVLAPVIGELVAVELSQGKLLVPLTEVVREQWAIPFLPFTDEGVVATPDGLARLCAELSARGRIAYLEAEFFGGQGMQAVLLAEQGRILGEHESRLGAINSALSRLGVAKGTFHDEFEAAGLGRARNTEEWPKLRAAPPSDAADKGC